MKKTICFFLAAVLLGGVVGYAVSKHPFTDVSDGAYYADAVQWAWKQGITNGVDSEHFEPNRAITRAEFVTMLWRWSGNEPEIDLRSCSVCEHMVIRADCNYCPNCGAKMEVSE